MGGASLGLFTGIRMLCAAMALNAAMWSSGGFDLIQVVKKELRRVAKKMMNAVKNVTRSMIVKAGKVWKRL